MVSGVANKIARKWLCDASAFTRVVAAFMATESVLDVMRVIKLLKRCPRCCVDDNNDAVIPADCRTHQMTEWYDVVAVIAVHSNSRVSPSH